MDTDKKNKIISTIIIYSFLIGTFFFSLSLMKIRHEKDYTIAEIKEFRMGSKGKRAIYQYKVNGEKFTTTKMYNFIQVIGEKYKLVYDKTKPKKALVIYESPVFLKNEKVAVHYAEVYRIFGVFKKRVFFRYRLGGREYEKMQYVPDSVVAEKDSILHRNFKIFFWIPDPRRSVIYLDEPLPPDPESTGIPYPHLLTPEDSLRLFDYRKKDKKDLRNEN